MKAHVVTALTATAFLIAACTAAPAVPPFPGITDVPTEEATTEPTVEVPLTPQPDPTCDTIMHIRETELTTQYPTYWTLSINFKRVENPGNTPTVFACLRLYSQDQSRSGPYRIINVPREGIPVPLTCNVSPQGAVGFKQVSLTINSQQRSATAAVFDKNGALQCALNLKQMIDDAVAAGGIITNSVKPQPQDVYTYEQFSLGSAMALSDTIQPFDFIVYESSQPGKCPSADGDRDSCTVNQSFVERGSGPSGNATSATIRTILNGKSFSNLALVMATKESLADSECALRGPPNANEPFILWSHVGPDALDKRNAPSSGEVGLFHYLYDIENENKQLSCKTAFNQTVNFFMLDSILTIQNASDNPWMGELYEIIIDPGNSGPGPGKQSQSSAQTN
jgi:hypothetical protein